MIVMLAFCSLFVVRFVSPTVLMFWKSFAELTIAAHCYKFYSSGAILIVYDVELFWQHLYFYFGIDLVWK